MEVEALLGGIDSINYFTQFTFLNTIYEDTFLPAKKQTEKVID